MTDTGAMIGMASPALRTGALRLDGATLADLAEARARWLRAAGLRPAEVVICPVEPAADLILMLHALPRVGAALLPVRAGLAASELAALAAAVGAEWIWQPAADAAAMALPTRQPGHLTATGSSTAAAPAERGPGADPLALLMQTSGSAGAAKLAMLTAAAVAASCRRINARLGLGVGDAWLGVLPRQHVGGLAIPCRCALAGAEAVLHDGFDAAAVLAELAGGSITHLSLVPAMLARLLDRAGANQRPPPTLRVVLLGGQSLDPGLARRALDGGWPLWLGYGMTETFSMIAAADLAAGVDADPATGRVPTSATAPALIPLPDVAIEAARCADGPSGTRLRLRGPMLMAGYANPARRPGDGLDDGWLATADLGCIDGAGRLAVHGRADDLLVIGGVNVLPARVEALLAAAPGIGEVAVAGIAEPVWGARLVAVYTGPAAPAALEAWCRAVLDGAERPRGFVPVERLPLLASGKRDRAAINLLAAGG